MGHWDGKRHILPRPRSASPELSFDQHWPTSVWHSCTRSTVWLSAFQSPFRHGAIAACKSTRTPPAAAPNPIAQRMRH